MPPARAGHSGAASTPGERTEEHENIGAPRARAGDLAFEGMAARPPHTPSQRAIASEGMAASLLELGEELRAEGVAVGTSELLDAFA
ncbi:MAG TPA: hypothetical protein VNU24_04170, partial [Solirubrobacteraceae bacterium]|nr:hypothetical protein [Solirubrobacteraceae bacterium]